MTPRVSLLTIVLAIASPGVGGAQDPSIEQPRAVFRLGVSLVQLDAVVTDRSDRHVTNLGPDDFVVYQDGRPQRVMAAYYVRATADDAEAAGGDRPSVDLDDTKPWRVEDARRVIALIVDDRRISFGDFHYTKRALQRFVRDNLRPGDLAGIVTTSASPGTAHPLTFDHAALEAAIGRLRFSGAGLTARDALDGQYCEFGLGALTRRIRTGDAIRRIHDVIDAMASLPGRKSAVLISPGFRIGVGFEGRFTLDLVRQVVDRANRAGVTIYAIDPRGLLNPAFAAAEDASASSSAQLDAAMTGRRWALRDTQDGLRFLAAQTGGFAVVNANDIRKHLRRIANDGRGYYLIGYEPEPGTFGPSSRREYRRVAVEVKREDLTIRARRGFYAAPTD